jgi:hypothetical protein
MKELVQTACTDRGKAAIKSGSGTAAPHRSGKATNSDPDQSKPKKKVFQ